MAVDYYLKLDGIEGESVNAKFKNQIQLLSWNWGASQVSSVEANGARQSKGIDNGSELLHEIRWRQG